MTSRATSSGIITSSFFFLSIWIVSPFGMVKASGVSDQAYSMNARVAFSLKS